MDFTGLWKNIRRTMAGEAPPHVSVLLNRLCGAARAFSRLYEENIQRMRDIACQLREIANKAEELQNKTFWTSMGGTGLQVLGCGVGLLTAFGLGAKMATVEAGAGAIGGALAAAIAGGVATSEANLKKSVREREMLKSVEELDNEFANITELQKKNLEEIKRVSDELEQSSTIFRSTAGEQALAAVSEIEEFQQLVKRMSEMTEEEKVTVIFTQSAKQCDKTVEELDKIKSVLRDFEEN